MAPIVPDLGSTPLIQIRCIGFVVLIGRSKRHEHASAVCEPSDSAFFAESCISLRNATEVVAQRLIYWSRWVRVGCAHECCPSTPARIGRGITQALQTSGRSKVPEVAHHLVEGRNRQIFTERYEDRRLCRVRPTDGCYREGQCSDAQACDRYVEQAAEKCASTGE